jgi:hypothetical protein
MNKQIKLGEPTGMYGKRPLLNLELGYGKASYQESSRTLEINDDLVSFEMTKKGDVLLFYTPAGLYNNNNMVLVEMDGKNVVAIRTVYDDDDTLRVGELLLLLLQGFNVPDEYVPDNLLTNKEITGYEILTLNDKLQITSVLCGVFSKEEMEEYMLKSDAIYAARPLFNGETQKEY